MNINDGTVMHLLGYLKPEQWRDALGSCDHDELSNVLKEVDAYYGMGLWVEVFGIKCPYCEEMLEDEAALRKHLEEDEDDDFFKEHVETKCDICGAKFSEIDDAVEHVRKKHIDLLVSQIVGKPAPK